MTSDVALPPYGLYNTTTGYPRTKASPVLTTSIRTDDQTSVYLDTLAGHDPIAVGFSLQLALHGDQLPKNASLGMDTGDPASLSDQTLQELQYVQAPSARRECQCISCLEQTGFTDIGLCTDPEICRNLDGSPLRIRWSNEHGRLKCPIADCEFMFCGEHTYHASKLAHLRSHCRTDDGYRCTMRYCSRATKSFKRWADLTRHAETAHCNNAAILHCPVLGCKYHDRLGFTRKDKLASHAKIHAGSIVPGREPRRLKPASKKGKELTMKA